MHVGEATCIQDGSVLYCDPGFPLTIGRNVTVGHQVMLHGRSVGDGALIGFNSVILIGAKIGAGSLAGTNGLVPEGREIPPGVLVVGTPAKVVRELIAEEKEGLPRISSGYVERSRRFKLQLREQQLPPSVR